MKKIILLSALVLVLAGCVNKIKDGPAVFPPPPVPIGTPIEPLKTIPDQRG